MTFGLLSWCATLQAFCFGRKPKARVAIVWLIQKGIDLTQKEVRTLEEAGFPFD